MQGSKNKEILKWVQLLHRICCVKLKQSWKNHFKEEITRRVHWTSEFNVKNILNGFW